MLFILRGGWGESLLDDEEGDAEDGKDEVGVACGACAAMVARDAVAVFSAARMAGDGAGGVRRRRDDRAVAGALHPACEGDLVMFYIDDDSYWMGLLVLMVACLVLGLG